MELESQGREQVPLSQVSGNMTQSQSQTPMLDAMSAAVQRQQQLVQAAAESVNKTPQFTSQTSAPKPQMPVQKPGILQGASVHNLANQHPQTVGGARSKAIGQIAAQAGGVVGAYMKKKESEKTQALAIDLNRSIELQQGMDEAKQVLQNDPNNAQAKATLQKNQTLMTALLNGKSGKDIGKAYGVTFGDEAKKMSHEDKESSMHHQAMQQAMKQSEQDRLQKFEASRPASMAPNPHYAQAQAQLQATQKAAEAAEKTYATLYGKVYSTDHADARAAEANKTRENVARTAATSRTDAAQIKGIADLAKDQQHHVERMAEIRLQGSQRLGQIKEMKKTSDQFKAANSLYTTTSSALKENNSEITKLTQSGAKLNSQGEPANTKSDIDVRLAQLTKDQSALKDQQNEAAGLMMGDPDAASMMSVLGELGDK